MLYYPRSITEQTLGDMEFIYKVEYIYTVVTLARKNIFPLDEVCIYVYHNINEYTILDKNLINYGWLYCGQVSMKGEVQCGNPE